MRLGILGTADIAFRRFLPALRKCPEIEYAGVASRTPEKGKPFADSFGGIVYPSYDALLADESIDAVYVPLPPALHFEWGKKALEAGDLDAAFEAAHALKGVTGNLALTPIYEPVQVVTELLRSRTETDYSANLAQIEAALADLRALCAD